MSREEGNSNNKSRSASNRSHHSSSKRLPKSSPPQSRFSTSPQQSHSQSQSHYLPSLSFDDTEQQDKEEGQPFYPAPVQSQPHPHHQLQPHHQPQPHHQQQQQRRRHLQKEKEHPLQNKIILVDTTSMATTSNSNSNSSMSSHTHAHAHAHAPRHHHHHGSYHQSSSSNDNNKQSNNKQSNNNNNCNQKQLALTTTLSKYARGNDRRQLLRSLSDPSQFPTCHNLKPVQVEDIAAAEREAAGERGILNGVKFLKMAASIECDSNSNININSNSNINTPTDSYFLQTLREISTHMCDMDGVYADPMALYGGLLLRLSRSISERDALEVTTNWLGGGKELVVLPLVRRHHAHTNHAATNTINTNSTAAKVASPIDVELYVESGNVHAKVTMIHELGLFRKTDLELHGIQINNVGERNNINSNSASALQNMQYQILTTYHASLMNLKPWIFVDAEVVERINFGSGTSVRLLYVKVPERKNSGYAS